MLLQANGIQKYFGAELCLADISFDVNEQDRIGIIGQNGAGKTTLLKLITGEYEPDAGELSFARGVRVGYLEQNARYMRKCRRRLHLCWPPCGSCSRYRHRWRRAIPRRLCNATVSFRP